jgi:hypothetical protein
VDSCIVEHLEAALIGADLETCDDINRRLWQAYAAGEITDTDAGAVSEAVASRRQAIKAAGPKPTRPPTRQRREPRSPDRAASLERKRRVASSGALPPNIAANFTQGEIAALSVIAGEVRRCGHCAMFIDEIAALAGVCRSTVKNAIRLAANLGLLSVTQRRRRGRLSDTNIVEIIDRSWTAWLKLRSKGQKYDPPGYKNSNSGRFRPSPAPKGLFERSEGARSSSSYADTA